MALKVASDRGVLWLALAYCLYGGAFAAFPEVLKVVKVGEAYAIWSGAGCIITAVGGWALFGERLSSQKVASIALIFVGVCGVTL